MVVSFDKMFLNSFGKFTRYFFSTPSINYIRTSRKSVNFETMSQSDMKEKKKKKMKRKKFLARENPLCNGSESRLTEDEEKRHVYEHVHIRDKRSPTAQAENLRDSENRGVSSALESFRLRA